MKSVPHFSAMALADAMRATGESVCRHKRFAAGRMHVGESAAFCAWVVALALAVAATPAGAQTASADSHVGKSADQVARELANPNNSLASLTFKNQFRSYTGSFPGADDQANYTLWFQPVFPFPLQPTASGGKANLFVRPAFPLMVDQPVPTVINGQPGFEDVTALGDIGFDIGYGVTEKSGLLWAYGMVGTLPTATKSEVAGKQLRLGPEALFAKFEKWGLYGAFPSHQWNVAGWSNTPYSTSQLQLFLKFLPGGGWAVGTTPIMDYDWRTKEWSIPLNVTTSKTIKLGDIPLKLELEVNYYVARPDVFGPKWMIGFNITPVVHNFLVDLLK